MDQAKEIMKQNTRRLAKRQLTWFRKEKRLDWVKLETADTPERIAKTIMDQWNNKS